MFQTIYLDKIKTHTLCSVTFSPKIVPIMRHCRRIWYGRTGHRYQFNTVHPLCMLEN